MKKLNDISSAYECDIISESIHSNIIAPLQQKIKDHELQEKIHKEVIKDFTYKIAELNQENSHLGLVINAAEQKIKDQEKEIERLLDLLHSVYDI